MTPSAFGAMLCQLRKRAGMTQSDLAAAVGYSPSLISSLEKGKRQVEVQALIDLFIPALALHDDPRLATNLVELATAERGERLPATLNFGLTFQPANASVLQNLSHPLPIPPTALVGREDEVQLLISRFIGHGGRLLTLTGAPGVGKTRLALEAAMRLKPYFEHGVRFIPLANIREADRVPLAISNALEIPDNNNRTPQNNLIQCLRYQAQLLVLDNFEQILASAPFLAELLAECSHLHLLVTSRERLHLRAEQRFPVQPLTLEAATQLFLHCAQSAAPDFCVTKDDKTVIKEICRRVDCLPLAIELVASRLDMFTPQMIWAQLQKRGLDLLQDGPTDLPARHRILRATIFDSYTLLNETEQRLFRALAVFRGGFDEEALQSVGSDVETLRSLLNKSLVVQDRQFTKGQRFLLLETLHEFAQEQLAASGELQQVGDLHLQHFLALTEELQIGISSDTSLLQNERVQTEYENIIKALRWAIAQRDAESAARFIWPLRLYWLGTLRWTGTRELSQEILDCVEGEWNTLLELPQADLTPRQRSYLALFAKVLLICSERPVDKTHSTADRLLERCVKISEKVEPDILTPSLFHRLAQVKVLQGNFAEAISVSKHLLQILETMTTISEKERKHEIAWTYGLLGGIAFDQRDLVGCREYCAQASRVYAQNNQFTEAIGSLLGLCEAELHFGELEEARMLLDTCRTKLADLDDKFDSPFPYSLATTLAIQQQEWQVAKTAMRQGVQFFAKHPQEYSQVEEPFLLVGKCAWLLWREKHYKYAAQVVGMTEALRQKCEVNVNRGMCLDCMAEYDATVACVRAALDESTFASWYAKGLAMKEEEIFAWILEKTAGN